MTIEEFNKSLQHNTPPLGLTPLLLALWYDAKGDWQKSHAIIQDIETKEAALIHAYLHRKEGDDWNADYWYSKSGMMRQEISLQAEFNEVLKMVLQQ